MSFNDAVKLYAKDIVENIKNTPNKQGGFIKTATPYQETGNLTTKILKDLEGKTTVSKQYILDATNRGELKQVERDITRQVLDTMPDGPINVKDFADRVKAELLPLKVSSTNSRLRNDPNADEYFRNPNKYENITLPDELRGNVKNYKENIYESPIKTSAGSTHFSGQTNNYFGHTRIEDMADNKTRRVIEVQSDLYQKGNLERETQQATGIPRGNELYEKLNNMPENANLAKEYDTATPQRKKEIEAILEKQPLKLSPLRQHRVDELKKLSQYNDPTAHFRMVREEIKEAAQDGKTKLQFPTGETAMKVERLVDNTQWRRQSTYARNNYHRLTTDDLKVGANVNDGNTDWIITDVLGDGKFKAVPKNIVENSVGDIFTLDNSGDIEDALTYMNHHAKDALNMHQEQFDISDKVDTSNPIYKFYEKDLGKYLQKYGAKRIVDDKGVSWYELPITKEQGKAPVEAFGKVQLNPLLVGAGILGAGVIGTKALTNKK